MIINRFDGKNLLIDKGKLPEHIGIEAQNFENITGSIEPIPVLGSAELDLGSSVLRRTIYKYNGSWLYWTDDVDVVKGPISVDIDKKRTFVTGQGYPKQFTTDLITTSCNPIDNTHTRRLGVHAPVNPPGTIVYHPTQSGKPIKKAISYVYTYVVQWLDGSEEESAPSEATAILNLEEDTYIEFSPNAFSYPTLTSSGNSITHIRIYRLNAGEISAEYQQCQVRIGSLTGSLVWDIPVANLLSSIFDVNSTHDDVSLDSGILIQTEGWLPPADDLIGLKQYQNGILIGFRENELWASEPLIPYAWPLLFMIPFNHDIVGIEVWNNQIFVFTTGYAYVVYGSDPRTFAVEPLFPLPCVSKRGICKTPKGVIFPSKDGIYLITTNSYVNLTQKVLTPAQWLALNPQNLITFYYKEQVYCFFNGYTDGFILNLEVVDSIIDLNSIGGIVFGGIIELESLWLYLVIYDYISYKIQRFGGGITNYTYKFTSKQFQFNQWISFPWLQIEGDNFDQAPVSVDISFNKAGTSDYSITISNNDPVRLPAKLYKYLSVTIQGTKKLDAIQFLEEI